MTTDAGLGADGPFRNFLVGASSTGALASHISREARTRDSRTGASCLNDRWRTGTCEGSSAGDGGADFFEFLLSHHVDADVAFLMDSQIDEALVLVDLTEDESDAGEELPEEVVE